MTVEEKIESYNAALSIYHLVATWLDASQCKGLPPTLKGHIRLDFGLIPIPDLLVDENGISGTLSFSRRPHFVVLPWKAILGWESSDSANQRYYDKQAAVGDKSPNVPTGVIAREGNVIKVKFGK